MSTFKRAKVVMLPTNEKAEKCLMLRHNRLSYQPNYLTQEWLKYNDATSHHIYITSNDEIKEGDWCIMLDDFGNVFSKPQHYNNPKTQYLNKGLKKIIATTAIICTGYNKETSKTFNDYQYLPQPSQSFIEKYVEEYNKDNIITDVMVEYEEIFIPIQQDKLIDGITKVYWLPQGVCSEYTYHKNGEVGYMIEKGRENEYSIKELKLKINPKDNTITIKKVKDSWSRKEHIKQLEEVADLSYKAGLLAARNGVTRNDWTLTDWIEENL